METWLDEFVGMGLSVDDSPEQDAVQSVTDGLDSYNLLFAQGYDHQLLNLVVRNSKNDIIAGILGDIFWEWLHVNVLWVREDYRHSGIGRNLLTLAENVAAKRGCGAVQLETHEFQALGFYQKRGYEVFGELADFPPGHSKYYLVKRLSIKNERG